VIAPFDENILFVDTEFTSLDPYLGELLSVALIRPDGEEFYVEIEHEGFVSEFARERVLPYLAGPKVPREEAQARIRGFVGAARPRLLANVDSYDTIYLYKLFGMDDERRDHHPFRWQPLDLPSMLFAHGLDPEAMAKDPLGFARGLGIEMGEHRQHHALDDARLLRQVYLRLASGAELQ